jgi:two-component system sensor histidine kinase PilS (NtrC family)
VHVHTQLTAAKYAGGERLCVMFLQDQREIEARMRTEKMASMGRMSAAVAHEIRNPLAAITQANALLAEDLADPRHKQLTQMVQQNAKRLERIVEEVLHISRVQQPENAITLCVLELNGALSRICRDWQNQTKYESSLALDLSTRPVEIKFESEHLRQILVNLLDNARRYATHRVNAIQVSVGEATPERVALSVWSDGPPLDQSVERHLFEPFFSSESRSSGLGLYICREICENYGASIAYDRSQRNVSGQPTEGNEFLVRLRTNLSKVGATSVGAQKSITP